MVTRRLALQSLLGAPAQAQRPPRFTKSICSIIFPDGMPMPEKFRRARDAGFAAIEVRFTDEVTPANAREIGDAARKAGIGIATMWVSRALDGQNPLNSPDSDVRARGLQALQQAIAAAVDLGCPQLLIVAGRLGAGAKLRVGYQDTWNRFTEEFKKALPFADKARVCLTPENVWNKFLVSPLEMRAFVDQFQSAWLQTHFDVGNVMQYGYPQDWILTLGPRIRGVHFKDYKLSTRAEQGRFVDLLEGDVDWKEVMAALVQVGYHGFISPEISHDPSDSQKIHRVAKALDQILALA